MPLNFTAVWPTDPTAIVPAVGAGVPRKANMDALLIEHSKVYLEMTKTYATFDQVPLFIPIEPNKIPQASLVQIIHEEYVYFKNLIYDLVRTMHVQATPSPTQKTLETTIDKRALLSDFGLDLGDRCTFGEDSEVAVSEQEFPLSSPSRSGSHRYNLRPRKARKDAKPARGWAGNCSDLLE